jgi:hypothetical protein
MKGQSEGEEKMRAQILESSAPEGCRNTAVAASHRISDDTQNNTGTFVQPAVSNTHI